MRKTVNQTHVEGYLYEHKLQLRTAGENSKNPGTQFIMGTIDIATDEALTNIIQVHYTYVTPTTKSGATSQNFTILSNIINGVYKTVMGSGKEEAAKLRIDSAIGLNEFYSSRNGAEELVSVKRNEGGFIHVVTDALHDESERNTFKVDMVITNVFHVEADPDRGLEERATIKGCIFDFRNAILPVEFTAVKPGAIDFYTSLEPSPNHPVFIKFWGKQVSQAITRVYAEDSDSSWGEGDVRTVTSNRKDWIITGGSKEPYTFGGADDDISTEEMKKAMSDRELYIAGIKARQDAYQSSRAGAAAADVSNAAATAGGFNF